VVAQTFRPDEEGFRLQHREQLVVHVENVEELEGAEMTR
jgi:hypothetical protein